MHWSTSGTVEAYVINFMDTIKYHTERPGVYLIIESYVGHSTKQTMRSSRSGNDANRKHQLSLHTTLPTQNVALKVLHNKLHLINLICHYLINPNLTPVQAVEQCQSPDRRSDNKPRRSRCHQCTSLGWNCVRSK